MKPVRGRIAFIIVFANCPKCKNPMHREMGTAYKGTIDEFYCYKDEKGRECGTKFNVAIPSEI